MKRKHLKKDKNFVENALETLSGKGWVLNIPKTNKLLINEALKTESIVILNGQMIIQKSN